MNLGVYVHFPFCEKRCPYCDFVTTDREDLHRLHRAGYVDVLRREWAMWRERHPEIGHVHLTSVFFGGGTPNLLTAKEISPLLTDILAGVGGLDVGLEITMEMNPGLSDRAELERVREAGINRASVGVQATSDRLLQTLGRIHTAADARRTIQWARELEFDSINADLMFAIPGQSLADWEQSLADVVSWGVDHVSAYNLTAKDETPLGDQVRAGEVELPGESRAVEMFERAHGLLNAAGYEHVEISNFAKPGHRCRHNWDVWMGLPYVGIGLGAHSYVGGERGWNTASWEDYHRAIGAGEMALRIDTSRNAGAERLETIYLGMRTTRGIDPVLVSEDEVQALCDEGLAENVDGRLRLTLRGWCVADAIVGRLVG